ncbi:MAG: hypothetical protein PPFGHCPK_01106 [Spiroplasma endosymbiont of Drosophila atripex]|nr:MAG: hypothetical protein PPFGHCPK_01106 [Spiroplasma endosymbiont of Drosophila atripex]
MDWQSIIEIIAAITGIGGGGIGVKTLQNNKRLKEKIKNLEQQININQNQFNEVKMHIMNIENKIDLIFMNINNSNTNEIININKQKEKK